MPDEITNDKIEQPDSAEPEPSSRYPDLDLLQQDVSRRLRDNQRFLDHFLDEDFMDELDAEGEDEEIDPDDFEEL
jgi:hypothetical protein